MITTVLLWLLNLLAALCLGDLLLTRLEGFRKIEKYNQILIATWVGILSYSSILLLAASVVRISSWLGLCTSMLAIAAGTLNRASRESIMDQTDQIRSIKGFAVLLGLLCSCALFANRKLITVLDTGNYIYPIVKWYAEYGLVPGVPSISVDQGYNSSWLALIAPWVEFGDRFAAFGGGLTLFLAMSHFGICLSRVIQRKSSLADCFFLVATAMYSPNILLWAYPTSPSINYTATVGLVFFAWLILELSSLETEGNKEKLLNVSMIPLVVAANLVNVKMTAIGSLVFGIFYFIYRDHRKGVRWLTGLVIALTLISPLLISNFITSGCPAYPFPLCLSTPWYLDPTPFYESVKQQAQFGYQVGLGKDGPWYLFFHKTNGLILSFVIIGITVFLDFLKSRLAKPWLTLFTCLILIYTFMHGHFSALWLAPKYSAMILSVPVIGCLILMILNRAQVKMLSLKINMFAFYGLFVTIFCAVVPSIRLAAGYGVVLPALVTALSFTVLSRSDSFLPRLKLSVNLSRAVCIIAIAIFFGSASTIKSNYEKNIPKSVTLGDLDYPEDPLSPLLLPHKMLPFVPAGIPKRAERFEVVEENGITYYGTHGGRCWDSKPPCGKSKGVFLLDKEKGLSGGVGTLTNMKKPADYSVIFFGKGMRSF